MALSKQDGQLENKVSSMEQRIPKLEHKFDENLERIHKIDIRVSVLESNKSPRE